MTGPPQGDGNQQERIILGLLESVSRDGTRSQRHLAADLDIALGLVNAYLRRCIKKGLVKVSSVPAHRYAYYLTPSGFAEKSRLTVEYLTSSFGFFRQAKADCAEIFADARARGFTRVALAGKSDLAEVASICALESALQIVALVDAETPETRFLDVPVVKSFAALDGECDAVIVTDLIATARTYKAALAWGDATRVLVPGLLRGHLPEQQEETP